MCGEARLLLCLHARADRRTAGTRDALVTCAGLMGIRPNILHIIKLTLWGWSLLLVVFYLWKKAGEKYWIQRPKRKIMKAVCMISPNECKQLYLDLKVADNENFSRSARIGVLNQHIISTKLLYTWQQHRQVHISKAIRLIWRLNLLILALESFLFIDWAV